MQQQVNCMHMGKNIQVRDVPDRTHEVLRRRAAEAGMSLQEYLVATLNDVAARPSVAEVLARAGGRSGGRVGFSTAVKDVRSARGAR
jgi:plasmid stability protein